MLTDRCFTREWIDQQATELRARDAQLVEKCIMAFEVVGRLAAAGLDFVFKGGTSLLLHLDPIRRLSIDADIVTPANLDEIQAVLRDITQSPPFVEPGFTYQDRRDRENPPTRYFQIHYVSDYELRPRKIQLDVQLAGIGYDNLIQKPIESGLLELANPQSVRVPTIEGLLGDKLSAFAPSTIGVLYEPQPRTPEGRKPDPDPTRVLKHMFDVGELFAMAQDWTAVVSAYDNAFSIQNETRGGQFTRAQCLEDTIDAAYHVGCLGVQPRVETDRTEFFRGGIQPLNNHLMGPTFSVNTASIPAARAAVLAALIQSGNADVSLADLRQLPEPTEIRELPIDGRFDAFARLWKLSPEAFYYWHLTSQSSG